MGVPEPETRSRNAPSTEPRTRALFQGRTEPRRESSPNPAIRRQRHRNGAGKVLKGRILLGHAVPLDEPWTTVGRQGRRLRGRSAAAKPATNRLSGLPPEPPARGTSRAGRGMPWSVPPKGRTQTAARSPTSCPDQGHLTNQPAYRVRPASASESIQGSPLGSPSPEGSRVISMGTENQ